MQNWYQNPFCRSGGLSGRLGAVLEPSWGGLGASWGGLGVVLGRLGAVSGRSRGVLGCSRGALGRLVAPKATERSKKACSGLFKLLGAL